MTEPIAPIMPEGPRPGWVYCVINPSMPGLVKIGCTAQMVEQRLAELDTTGVAMPFRLVGKWLSADMYRDEKGLHQMLAHARTRQSREWFEVSNHYLPDLVCEIGRYMVDNNKWSYNPPTQLTALQSTSWLEAMGGKDSDEMQPRPKAYLSAGIATFISPVGPRYNVMLSAIIIGVALILSYQILS